MSLLSDLRRTISLHVFAALAWALVALVAGLLGELQILAGFPDAGTISYGQLRPVFNVALIFGATTGLSLAGLYLILEKSVQWAPLAFVAFALQQFALLLGVVFLVCGVNSGREYGEMNWISNDLFLLSLVLVIAVVLKSLSELTAATLFLLIGLVGGAFTFFLGNLGLPYSPLLASPISAGMQDQAVQEFYRSSVLGFFVLFPLFGLLYHFVPSHFNLPIYNESAVKFQALAMAALIPVAGGAFLALGPGPQRTATYGITFGLALNVAIVMGAANLLYTISRGPHRVEADGDGKYLRWGVRLMLVLAVLRGLTLPRFMQAHVGYTSWNGRDIGFDALVLFATAAASIAVLYSERAQGKQVSSLARTVKTFAVAGAIVMILANVVQGITAGYAAKSVDEAGMPLVKDFAGLLFAGNLALEAGEAVDMRYLLGFRGLFLVGYLFTLFSMILWTLCIVRIWRKSGSDYHQPDLHLPDEHVPAQGAH
jgi:cbb3-type cytochrome oxidase subunit 1